MSYAPETDFLALLRMVNGGVRSERMPGLDFLVPAMARAGLFLLYVGSTPPLSNQPSTVWFKPALQSWAQEGKTYLWDQDANAYAEATPALWSVLLAASVAGGLVVVQDVTAPGPANVATNATVVRVNQAAPAPITLVMPLSSAKTADVLITDWRGDAGTNNIMINLSGADKFPGGFATWTIATDTGSVFLRRVPGGYAL